MTALPHPMLTVDDVLALPDDVVLHELIDGELIMTPAPAPGHQLIFWSILRKFGEVVPMRGRGVLLPSPIDVILSPTRLVQPDLVYIAPENLDILRGPRGLVEGAPDLVLEVFSPGSRRRDLVVKRAVYEEAGIREYWIVDPERREFVVLELVDGRYQTVEPEAEGRFRSRVLPELVLDPVEHFSLLDDPGY